MNKADYNDKVKAKVLKAVKEVEKDLVQSNSNLTGVGSAFGLADSTCEKPCWFLFVTAKNVAKAKKETPTEYAGFPLRVKGIAVPL